MDRKLLIPIVIATVAAVTFTRAAHGEQYYSSIYRHSIGDRYTLDFWNTRWLHIDNRIDTLEDLGSNVFSTIAVSGEDSVVADSSTDTLTFIAGANFSITTSASGDSIQFDVSTTPLDILGGGAEVVGGATDIDFDGNFNVTDEGSNEAGIALVDDPTIAGYLTVTEFIDIFEMSAPANPGANTGRLYSADSGGTTTLYYKDSAGTATNLLTGATDEAVQDAIYNNVLGGTQTLITVTYDDPNGEVDYVVTNDLGDAGWDWSNVVDADIPDTLTASIFVGSGSTTNAVDLATAEVSGTLAVGNIADQYIRNDQNDTTSGNIQLYDGVGDSPQLNLTDAGGDSLQLEKVDGGVGTIYADNSIIGLMANGDISDYISISTTSDVPRISTLGSCNLQIMSSSGTVDFNGSTIIGIGSLSSSNNVVLDDGVGDSPYVQLVDGDDNALTIQKHDSGTASIWNNEGAIVLMPSNDTDDYWWFSTASNEPQITVAGATSMNYGSGTVTDHTFTSDSTGNAEFVVPDDGIGDAEIDWGTGANQVSMVDIVDVKSIPFEWRLGVPDSNLDVIDFRQGRSGERLYANRQALSGTNTTSDLYVAVQIPADWGSWYNGDNVKFDVYCNDRTNNSITLYIYDDAEDVDDGVNGDDVEPGSDTTWTAISGVQLTETDYDQGDWISLKITVDLDSSDYYYISQGYLIYVPE